MSKFNTFPIGNPYKVRTSASAGTTTTATGITLLASVPVSANTFTVGDIITMEGMVSKSSTTNTYTMYFYWNTANNLTGAIQIGVSTALANTVRSYVMIRRVLVRVANGSGLGTLSNNTTTAVNSDTIVNAASSTLAINWTLDGYFIVAASHVSAAESVTGEWAKISLF